jgi:hypothetical protein
LILVDVEDDNGAAAVLREDEGTPRRRHALDVLGGLDPEVRDRADVFDQIHALHASTPITKLRLKEGAKFRTNRQCLSGSITPISFGFVWYGARPRLVPRLGSLLLTVNTGDSDVDSHGEERVMPEPLLDLRLVAWSLDFHEHGSAVLEDK